MLHRTLETYIMKSIKSSEKITLIFASSIFVIIPFIKSDSASIGTEPGTLFANNQELKKENNYKLKLNETCALINSCVECEYTELFAKTECLKTGLVDIYNCDNMLVYQECAQIKIITKFTLFTILIWFMLGWVLIYFMKYRRRLEIEMMKRIIGDDKNLKKN